MGALEGSSNTNVREKAPRIGKRGPLPKLDVNPIQVVTLDPKKFAEKNQKCFHIGGLQSFLAYISVNYQSSPVKAPRIKYDTTDGTVRPYPPDTRAFLYFFTSPKKPRIAGELRLRVTSSDDPASFESGSDLLLTNGQPWSRSLYSLSKYYSLLYGKLREEQLVPDDLDKVLSTFPSVTQSHRRGNVLHTLNDTFIIDFSYIGWTFRVITEQGFDKLRFRGPFSDHREKCKGRPPYTGSAWARFERSTLLEHRGTRTVVLRFFKIITPVKCVFPLYDGFVCCPKEGELLQRSRSTLREEPPVWSVNIDESKGAVVPGLRLLWDA